MDGPGQERDARAQLAAALERDAVAGAYLIEGPAGSGARRTGAWWAARLLGRNEAAATLADGEPPDPHPDLHWLAPEGGWIRVDAVRQLQAALALMANEGGRRVAVIEGAERLRMEAANALLKTLEEPPRDAVLILIATHGEGLPATVRSRLVRFRLPPWPEAALREALTADGLEPDDAWLAGALGGASPEAVRAWAAETLPDAREMWRWLRGIGSMGATEILDFAEDFRGGEKARARAELLIDVYEALARRETDQACRESDRRQVLRWSGRFEAGESARQELRRRNLNPQLVVEGLLMDLRAGA